MMDRMDRMDRTMDRSRTRTLNSLTRVYEVDRVWLRIMHKCKST